jgi:MYXO-CTERM domain-containing protein
MFVQQNGTKVALIGHSYGCNVAHTFLRRMSSSWKAQYIAGFISLSGPYAGSFDALLAILSGSFSQSHGIGFSAAELSALARNVTSTNFLIPAAQLYSADEVLVRLGDANYTHSQIDDMLRAHGLAAVAEWRGLIANVSADFGPPEVATLCMHGYNISTSFAIRYKDGTFNNAPSNVEIANTDGDGIVPSSSLTVRVALRYQPFSPPSHLHTRQPPLGLWLVGIAAIAARRRRPPAEHAPRR